MREYVVTGYVVSTYFLTGVRCILEKCNELSVTYTLFVMTFNTNLMERPPPLCFASRSCRVAEPVASNKTNFYAVDHGTSS